MRLQDLDSAQVQRVASLLDEALELTPEHRSAWQAQLFDREPVLSGLVAELLVALPPAGTVQADSHGDELTELLARALAVNGAAAINGRSIGPYRVVRELGRGGMGSVWLAKRADGLFDREVALKLPHPNLAGSALLARFARERSILAALAHPLIARLLDAGLTPDGQPYLALEYVDGESLTVHCDSRRLTIRERIALMAQVLSAVQHAHQALVVHRDLKPNNILVARDGSVRLLDFGIAKLISDGAGEATELTALGGRFLTPDYASPEQIAGRPIGTASDVYSLGVVLYVLLCGQRPYRTERNSCCALEDAILSVTPVRPSQQALDVEIASARSTSARKLSRALSGDLDTIVLKALKKSPSERYASADAMRRDLEHYLAGEPVEARPDGFAYRSAKFIARHRLAVGAACFVAILLLGAAVYSFHQAQFARMQAHVAAREAERARAVQAFLLGVFRSNSDQQGDPVRMRQATARELLDEGSRRIGDSLRSSPETQAEILDTLADMYHQLGLREDAVNLRLQRVAALKRARGENDSEVAEALVMLGEDLADTDDRARFAATLREAEAILDRLGDDWSDTRGGLWQDYALFAKPVSVGDFRHYAELAERHERLHPSTRAWWNLLKALQDGARARFLAGDYEQAEASFYATLREIDARGQANSAWSVTPLVWLAETQQEEMRLDEAEQNLQSALALSRHFNGDLHAATLQTQTKLGALWHGTGRRDDGMHLLDETALAIERNGANASASVTLRRLRGLALFEEGRLAEAAASLEPAVADLRAHNPGSIPLASILVLDAAVQTAIGHYERSAVELDEGTQLWRTCGGREVDPSTFNPYHLEWARLALARGDADAAERTMLPIVAPEQGRRSPRDRVAAQLVLARAHAARNRWAEARELIVGARTMIDAWPNAERFPRLYAELLELSGQARLCAGEPEAAAMDLDQAIELRVANEAPMSPWLAGARIMAAQIALALGQGHRAHDLFEKAKSALSTHPDLGEQFKAPLSALAWSLVRGSPARRCRMSGVSCR